MQRAFTLPGEIDPSKVMATYEDGILCVRLPKSEATRPKRVQIQTHGNGRKTVETQPKR